MTHLEIKNLSKELDVLMQYLTSIKATNPYLNYGLIRNAKILSKASKFIDEALSPRLKELETTMFQEGYKKFSELEKEDETLTNLPEIEKTNRIFNIGYSAASTEDRKERDDLLKEYSDFMNLEDDTKFYLIDFDGVTDINIGLQYWDTLDNFINNKK